MFVPPLTPGIKTSVSREHDPYALEADHEYQGKRLHILERDRYTCVSCRFSSVPDRQARSFSLDASGYLEVHHIDDDHGNNNDDNLITLCPFCHSCHHIGFAGSHNRILLIFLPWLTQEQINLLCNLYGVAIARGSREIADQARHQYSQMLQMNTPMESAFGIGTSNPVLMAGALGVLVKRNPELYDQRIKALGDVRVLPQLLAFNQAIEWWSHHSWLAGENWERAWRQLVEATQ